MVLDLPPDQVLYGDLQLLVLGIAGQLQHLHAIAQRGSNRVEDVGGGDEQHLGEVERHIEIVIAEGIVLLRVEDLQQRRRGVAAEVRAQLVDLVENEDGVLRFGAAQPLDDLAGQGADVGAAVAADLRLVAHAPERDADELAIEGARNRPRQRGLADARRTDAAENRPLHAGVQLAHREVLENAIFRLLESAVVVVEHLPAAGEIDDLFGPHVPGQDHEPIEIRPRHRVLGRRHRHAGQPVELAKRFLLHRLGHARGLDLLAELLHLLGVLVAFAQLLLNRLHLLAQQILALVLADLGLHLGLDLRTQLEDLELLDQHAVQLLDPLANIERAEHLLLDRRLDGGQARRDEVGELAGVGDVAGQRLQVVGQQRRQGHHLLEVALDVALQGIDLEVVRLAQDVVGLPHAGPDVRLRRQHLVQVQARLPLHDEAQGAVGQLEHLVDVGGGSDGVQLFLGRLFGARIELGEDPDETAVGDGLLDQADGALAGHREGHEGIRKQHRVAQRQHRQLGRDRHRSGAARTGPVEEPRLVAHRTILPPLPDRTLARGLPFESPRRAP